MNLKITTLISAIVIAAASNVFSADAKEEGIVLPKLAKEIKINGDIRLRHENRSRDRAGTKDSRNRLRSRFRLGMSFKTAYGWNAYAGLASGGADGTSTNATWNNGSTWETGDIRLDYAYIKHAFESDTVLTLGQQKNPFQNAGILWDSDLRPTGILAQQKFGVGFVTAGYLNVNYTGDSAMAEMLAAQVGIKTEGDVAVTAALAYYHGNGQTSKDPFGANTDYDYQYVDLYADLGFKIGEGSNIKAFAEYGMNIGADDVDTQMGGAAPAGYNADDNNAFYTVGAKAKVAKNVSLKAQYVVIEGDGVFTGLSNSDFGTGIEANGGNIDVEGYILGVGYTVTKNFSVGLSYLSYESIKRDDLEATLTQIDLKYKF